MTPDFQIVLEGGGILTRREFPTSSLTRVFGYGQSLEVQFTVAGELGIRLLESGVQRGSRITEFYMGYVGDLTLMGKNLIILADSFTGEEDDSVTFSAYGVSQFLRQAGERTVKIAAKTYAQAVREVAARWGLEVKMGSNAYLPLPNQPTTPTVPTTSNAPAVNSNGVVGAPKVSVAANAPVKKDLYQSGENDWAFLEKLAKQIGYIIAETPLGNALYFGPGLEVGERPRLLLVRGQYQAGSDRIAPLVKSISGERRIDGIPEEIVVTGIENGRRFALIVTPDDLAARHKVQLAPVKPPINPSATQNPNQLAGSSQDITGSARAANGQPRDAQGQFISTGTRDAGAQDFAGSQVGTLLRAAKLPGIRRVYGGATREMGAKDSALEKLALMNLRYQRTSLGLALGVPVIVAGTEIELQGNRIPQPYAGLHLVTEDRHEINETGYFTRLETARNTV
jgi:phage protein D